VTAARDPAATAQKTIDKFKEPGWCKSHMKTISVDDYARIASRTSRG